MISRDRPSPRHVLLWVLLSALFATYYILHSRVGSDSSIERHAELLIDPPFVFRVMIPWVLSKLLPMSWLDMTLTRTVIAAAFSLSSILLMPAFMARVLGRDLSAIERTRACRAIFIVLIAHYLLPRNLKFYYVYDLPAITFYEVCFLALTDRRNWVRWVGVATSTLFAFNRETIGIAVVHAAGWHIAQLWPRERRSPNSTAGVFLPLLISCVGILFVRTWLAQQLNHSVQQSFSWMEGDQLRLVANLIRMGTKFH
ncbi:MAG: hypothetical protein KGN37_16720, partial [Burkholderiales bacterium]|nr:hypothetical protein [Burkholderiales bacterium]